MIRRWLFERGGLIALATLALYVWIAPRHIIDGDNAEFATLGTAGGVAHPTGYPLYLLWLRALAWLPAASPAHATALATALLGAAQILVLHAACRAWGARPLAATIAVATFAAAPAVLRINSEAEVFALNGLVVATLLWLAASAGPLRGGSRVVVLALVAGLGLSDHVTCALVAPVGVLGVVRGLREARRARPAIAAAAAIAFALGLLPYLYLLVTTETPLSWGRVDGLGALVDHFLRRDFGGPGAFSAQHGATPIGDNLALLAATLGRTWLWLLPAAAVVPFVRPAGETRWGWAMLAASFALAGPLLALRFDLPPSWVTTYVERRFHVLPALLLAPAIAVGLDQLGTWLAPRLSGHLVRSLPITTGLALLGLLGAAATSLSYLRRVDSPAVEQGIRNMLHTLPRDAIVIEAQDQLYFGAGYLQMLGERPDVVVVDVPMLVLPWYRERCRRRGVAVDDRGAFEIDRMVAAGRPIFVDIYQQQIMRELPSYPFGILFRLLARHAALPQAAELLAINKAVFEQFVLGYEPPGLDDEYATDMHRKYATTWRAIGDELAAAGRSDEAAWAYAVAHDLGPRR